MHPHNPKKIGIARVKAHAIQPQQFKQLNRILYIGFAALAAFALLSSFFGKLAGYM